MTRDLSDLQLYKFIGLKRVFTYEERSTRTELVWNTNIAAVSLFWNTDMADVTSCENSLYSQFHLVDTSRNHFYNNNNQLS